MKRIFILSLLVVFTVAGGLKAAHDDYIGLEFGLSYKSFYEYRGGPNFMDRPAAGVIIPGIGYSLGDFYFGLEAEIAPAVLGINTMDETGGYGDGASVDEKAWTGLDLGVCWESELTDDLALGVEVWFLFYPFSKDKLGTDVSYLSGTISLSFISLPFTPTISYSPSFKPNASNSKFGDNYLSLSLSEEITLIGEMSSLEFGLNIGYWLDNSDGDELKGFSDVVLSAKYDVNLANGLGLWSSFHMGYVPQNDWAMGEKSGDFRVWLNFGIRYSL